MAKQLAALLAYRLAVRHVCLKPSYRLHRKRGIIVKYQHLSLRPPKVFFCGNSKIYIHASDSVCLPLPFIPLYCNLRARYSGYGMIGYNRVHKICVLRYIFIVSEPSESGYPFVRYVKAFFFDRQHSKKHPL